MKFVKVYVEHSALSLNQQFTYSCSEPVEPGCRVTVPFSGQILTGYVVSIHDDPDTDHKILPVRNVIDEKPLLNEELSNLAIWLADQCCASVISVLKTMLPPALKPKSGHEKIIQEEWLNPNKGSESLTSRQEAFLKSLRLPMRASEVRKKSVSMTRSLIRKGWLKSEFRDKDRDITGHVSADIPPQLRPDQQLAIQNIRESAKRTVLLHGVTGSGKTEVFLRLAEDALKEGKQVLFLVPEIGLTPMMTERVLARFQDQIAVYHSYLSPQEKYAQYKKVRDGKVRIVVGTRSACFMPFQNLGLILMDEEHDSSYKQDSMPRYHTRDVVMHRAEFHDCKVILASATPSLESYARAWKGVYSLVEMPSRINETMPEIRLVDMKRETVTSGLSESLISAVRERLNRKEQVILLLNRRGWLPVIRCLDCGDVRICPDCGIALSYHKKENRMVCHCCDRSFVYDPVCPACGSTHAASTGMGTEKLEEAIADLFPEARIVRMDADTTRKKGAHEKLLRSFRENGDILVGTQMVAKGLDFPNVTFVGILQADNSLIRTDYRAAESAYQMLEQASGRSGRGNKSGEVMIQTFDPDHYVLVAVKNHDYSGFFRREMQYRHLGNYPPYIYMGVLVFSHRDLRTAWSVAEECCSLMRDLDVLGPAVISMRKQKQRVRLLVRDKDPDRLRFRLWEIVRKVAGSPVAIDVNINPLKLEE